MLFVNQELCDSIKFISEYFKERMDDMQLKIGETIKMYRQKHQFTQEYLADRLNVSTTAVSKWESGAANPDVTLLIPIAKIFQISVDKLLGYDDAQEQLEIDRILNTYAQLNLNGQPIEAKKLIAEARMTYPEDFRIINEYMWNIVGGRNVKNRQILTSHYDEINGICKTILHGCENEKIRYEALLMKSKLLYTSGRIEEAVDILNSLPGWYESAEQQMEQLYEPESSEAIYWNQRNLYSLADGMANKLTKRIWSGSEISPEIKTEQTVKIGELFHESWIKTRQTMFLIMEHMVFAALAKKLCMFNASDEQVLKMMNAQLNAAKEITGIAGTDKALKDSLIRTYRTDNLLEYTISYFETSENDVFKRLHSRR